MASNWIIHGRNCADIVPSNVGTLGLEDGRDIDVLIPLVRISLHVAAISPIVFVCWPFVEWVVSAPISVIMKVSGARVPCVIVLSDARVPDVVMVSGARVPNVVVISGARVPNGVVISVACVPNGVVLPGARIHAARCFPWLVLAHRGWLKFKFRAQPGW